jgi:hypothetical protein
LAVDIALVGFCFVLPQASSLLRDGFPVLYMLLFCPDTLTQGIAAVLQLFDKRLIDTVCGLYLSVIQKAYEDGGACQKEYSRPANKERGTVCRHKSFLSEQQT